MNPEVLILIVGLIICAVSITTANEDAESGVIVDVGWPDSDVQGSAMLVPWVVVENTGIPGGFYIQFSIQDPNDKWYYGACWPTGVLNHGEEKVVWPSSVQVTASMPKGAYNAKVELFADADYCTMDALDTVTKNYAFRLSS